MQYRNLRKYWRADRIYRIMSPQNIKYLFCLKLSSNQKFVQISHKKQNVYIYRWSNSFHFHFHRPSNCGQILKERICFFWSKFFPFKLDPVMKGLYYPRKETGTHKSFFPFAKMAEKSREVFSIICNLYMYIQKRITQNELTKCAKSTWISFEMHTKVSW